MLKGSGEVVDRQKNERYIFDRFSKINYDLGPIAQRLEQQTHNLLVRGSNPCGPTSINLFYPESQKK